MRAVIRIKMVSGTTPGAGLAESYRDFEIGYDARTTILDALEALKSGGADGLIYRHSCHHGSCGTCGAVINGSPGLMCLSLVAPLASATIVLEPLRKMEVVGAIAVHPGKFFDSMPETGYVRHSDVIHASPNPEGLAWTRFEACIECGICVSACPVEAPFDGPAALAACDRDREEHPENEARSLAFASGPRGVAACDRRFACSRACPQSVAPGRRIENLRKSLEAVKKA